MWLPTPAVQAAPARLGIAIGSDSVPYYFQDKDGAPQGLLVDLWRLWAQKSGVAIEFKVANFGETLTMIREGRADIHAGCFASPQREQYLDFVVPVCTVQANFFAHRNLFGLKTVEDLRGFRVGVINGDYALEHLASRLPQSSLAVFPSNQALFQAIAQGDIVVFVKDTAIALEQLSRIGMFNQFRFDIERPLYERQWFAAVRQGDNDLAQLIRQGMERISPEEKAAIELRWIRRTSVKTKDHLVISCPKGNAPFTMLTASARPAGLLVDFWRLWAQRTNKQVEFRFADWLDSLRAVELGQADIHSGLFPTQERAASLELSEPFFGAVVGVFFNPKRLRPAGLQDLAGQLVGVVEGSFLERHLGELMPGARLRTYPDTDAMIHAAVDGEVGVFAAEVAAALNGLDRLGERDTFVRLPGWQVRNPVCAAVGKDNHGLLSLVQAGFKAINTAELAQIERRWISAQESRYLGEESLRPVLSPGEKAWLDHHKVILLGAAQNYPPLDFISAQGVHQGLAAEYLALLGRRLGIRFEAVGAFAWAEMLEKVKRKELMGVACIAQSPEREAYLRFSKPYFFSPYMVFTGQDHPPVTKLADLAGQTVAIERGFFLEHPLRQQFPAIKLLSVSDTPAALEAVSVGQAQAYVGNLLVAQHLIKHDPSLKIKIACTAPWPGAQLRIGVREDWPELVTILDKALESITSQEQAEINSKWLWPQAMVLPGSVTMSLTPRERAWLENHRRIRLGVDPNWAPFEFLGPDRAYSGMASDYVRLVEEKLGVRLEVAPDLDWPQALAQAKAGGIDVFACIAKTPERSEFLNFTKPYLQFPMVIVTRIDAPFVSGLDDLKGMTVAVGKGYASEELLRANHPDLALRPVNQAIQGLEATSRGEIDAFVGNLATVTHVTREAGLTNLKIAAATPYSYDLSFGVRKDWPELVGVLEKALAGISPEQKTAIHNAWISMRFEHGVDWRAVWRIIGVIVAVFLAVTALFLYWNRRLQKVVNQRRQAEEALSKSESQLRSLINSSADTIIVLDTQRRFVDCNAAFSEQFGHPRAAVIGQSARMLHLDDDAYERFGRDVYPHIQATGSWRGEWDYRRRSGERVPMETVLSAYRGPDGDIIGYSAVMRDITERKRTEEALRAARQELEDRVAQRTVELEQVVGALREEIDERRQVEESLRKSEEEHRAVLDASPNCIVAYDSEGRTIYVNPSFTRVFGWTAAEVIGRRIDFVPESERETTSQAIARVYELKGGVHSFESRRHTRDGRTLDVSIHAAVFMDAQGSPMGMLVNLEDISERKRNEEELRKYRLELERLVEERTAELAVAMEKAQEADRLKSAFLASMSHELRTPLNSIIGFTGIILQGLVGPLNDEQAKQMGMVQHSARHLLSLINDVLDISKIEAGQLKVDSEPFDMVRLINEVMGVMRPAADKKGLALESRLAPEVGELVSDRRRVEQILINLLNNALKFTDSGGVYLDCRVENGHLVTSVRDTGIGIKPEDQENLFKAFRQIDTGLARRYEGTGLGLNICRRLMELLGGEIWVDSAGSDRGSTFTFTLPLEGSRGHG